MAGDWVAWSVGFSRKREVVAVAAATGRDRRLVACLLMEFFEWAGAETESGFLPGISVRILSALHADVGDDIFRALIDVGWLRETDEGVLLVNFERWNGRSAKRRLQESRRKQEVRGKIGKADCGRRPQSVRKVSANEADKNGTRVEESIGEKKNPPNPPPGGPVSPVNSPPVSIPVALDTPDFRRAWGEWEAYRRETRHPLKDSSRVKQLRSLEGWGPARAVAAIDHSIAQGYRGLFEPSGGSRAPPPGRGTFEEQLARVKGRIDAEANGRDGP